VRVIGNAPSSGAHAGARHRRRLAIASLAVATALSALLAFASVTASAATVTTPTLVSSLTPPPSATPNGPFAPVDVAVNQTTGNLYVLDAANDVIQVFNSSGAFLSTMDGSNTPFGSFSFHLLDNTGAYETSAVAIDNSGGPTNGRIYVHSTGTAGLGQHLTVFSSSGVYLFGTEKFGGRSPAINSQGDLAYLVNINEGNTIRIVKPTSAANLTDGVVADFLYADALGNLYSTLSGLLTPGADSGKPFAFTTLAFDSEDNIYATAYPYGQLSKLDSDGNYLYGLTEGGGTTGAAVDRDTNDVYVIDGRGTTVSRYSSTGTLLHHFGLSTVAEGIPIGNIGNGVAVGIAYGESANKLYVADFGDNRVAVFGTPQSTTAPDPSIEAASEVTETTATLNGTVNPQGSPASWRFQYRPVKTRPWRATELQAGGSGGSPESVSAPVGALVGGEQLEQNREYEMRLQAANATNGAFQTSSITTFTTPGPPQAIVTIASPSDITSSGAQISGSIDPNGSDTKWKFQYSTDDSFEEDWLEVGPTLSLGSSDPVTEVEDQMTDLAPNTQYFVRLVAINNGGPKASNVQTFTTGLEKPRAVTLGAGCLGTDSACLGARIDPRHATTSYYFEYGTDTSYGTVVPASEDGDAGSGLGSVTRRAGISDLDPSTVYHYRVVATNQAGATASADASFRTRPTKAEAAALWPQRGIELVSNPEKGNQPITPGLNSISPDGEHALWSVLAGAPGSTVGSLGVFRADRTPQGWVSRDMMPSLEKQAAIADGTGVWELQNFTPDLSQVILSYGMTAAAAGPVQVVRSNDANSELLRSVPGPVNGQLSIGASQDLSHILIKEYEKPTHIYEVGDGSTTQVDLLPGGISPACGSDGISTPSRGHGEAFFTSSGNTCADPPALYMYDSITEGTALIAGQFSELTEPSRSGSFTTQTSPTGKAVVVFETLEALLGSDADVSQDIYRWTKDEGLDCITCDVAEASFSKLFVSEDATSIYFHSSAQLVPGEGVEGLPCGQNRLCNLYRWHDGELTFATFIAGDILGVQDPQDDLGKTAALTPSGEVVMFETNQAGITADDPGFCTVTGDPCNHLYRYDAANGGTECVSCATEGSDQSGSGVKLSKWFISSDEQTAAFVTGVALVGQDVNQSPDVYEWHNGIVRMITDGVTEVGVGEFTSPGVQGISADGGDILFRSNLFLTGHEIEDNGNLFDARIGGGFPTHTPPAACVEDSCQGPLQAPPQLSNAGSAAFAGSGNTQVRKQRAKKRRVKQKAKQRRAKQKAKQRSQKAKRTTGGSK
jgi:DNA-binding beta-propeller fold protein YncE